MGCMCGSNVIVWHGSEIVLHWSHYSPIQTFLLVKIPVSKQVIENECEQSPYMASLSSDIPWRAHVERSHLGSTGFLKALQESHLEGLTSALSEVAWKEQMKKKTRWLLHKATLWRFLMHQSGVSLWHLKIFWQYRCKLLMPSWKQTGNLLCLVAHLSCDRLGHCLD